ncbi:MAG: hypothetical protein K6F86_09685 [Lachnospiraceae bacterium]|nr:hypothetical protein [Lachnospiraceae bacterium]
MLTKGIVNGEGDVLLIALVLGLIFVVNAGYGGGFSNVPTLLSDHYGMGSISAIHGITLSAWAFAGLTGNQMATYIFNHTGQYISDVERGKYSLSLKKYMTICDHFGVSADELLYGASKDYSEYDIRNRIIRQMDGLSARQIELLEEQIGLMKKMFAG